MLLRSIFNNGDPRALVTPLFQHHSLNLKKARRALNTIFRPDFTRFLPTSQGVLGHFHKISLNSTYLLPFLSPD